jgi:hypothetical protein
MVRIHFLSSYNRYADIIASQDVLKWGLYSNEMLYTGPGGTTFMNTDQETIPPDLIFVVRDRDTPTTGYMVCEVREDGSLEQSRDLQVRSFGNFPGCQSSIHGGISPLVMGKVRLHRLDTVLSPREIFVTFGSCNNGILRSATRSITGG